jgi:flagellar protein FliO/FliZ
MFQSLFSPVDNPAAKPTPSSFLKRAGWFAGGLILLWLTVQFSTGSGQPGSTYTDDYGTVASNPATTSLGREENSLFRPGYFMALLLLAGGGAFAVYLRKGKPAGLVPHSHVQLLGKVQIAPTQTLRLVSCGGEVLLLGISSSQITLLKSYPPSAFPELKQDVAAGALSGSPATAGVPMNGDPHNTFAQVLSRFTGNAAQQRIGGGQ